MLLRASVIAVLSTLLAAGCGGGDGRRDLTGKAPRRQAPTRSPLALPAGVPRAATGPADPAATRTIRGWATALRAGDVGRATSYWALPARIQNGTPVLTLSSQTDLRTFNDSLSCGAVLTSAGAARGYTIATFRLTQRRGAHGGCGSGVGNRAQTAMLVRDRHIVGWFRLPDTAPAPVV